MNVNLNIHLRAGIDSEIFYSFFFINSENILQEYDSGLEDETDQIRSTPKSIVAFCLRHVDPALNFALPCSPLPAITFPIT